MFSKKLIEFFIILIPFIFIITFKVLNHNFPIFGTLNPYLEILILVFSLVIILTFFKKYFTFGAGIIIIIYLMFYTMTSLYYDFSQLKNIISSSCKSGYFFVREDEGNLIVIVPSYKINVYKENIPNFSYTKINLNKSGKILNYVRNDKSDFLNPDSFEELKTCVPIEFNLIFCGNISESKTLNFAGYKEEKICIEDKIKTIKTKIE